MPRIYWHLIAEFVNSARENNVLELRALLDAHPILINALDVHGRNALSVAGSDDAANFLAAHGAVDPGACRHEAVEAFKRYLASGDVYRLVEVVHFYEIDLVAVEHDLRRWNTTMFHRALPFPDVLGHLLDWTPVDLLDHATKPEGASREPGTTPLQAVARRGLEAIARRLIEMGVDYDPFSAVALGDRTRLATLPAGDLHAVDGNGAGLLHWAALLGSVDTASWLVQSGLDLNGANAFGETPVLMAALASGYPGMSNADERPDVIELLVDRGAFVGVFEAAALGDTKRLNGWLVGDRTSARATTGFNLTPLHFAAWAGVEDAAKRLLDAGAQVNAKDRHGRTPLFYAACWGRHHAMVDLLKENHADASLEDIWGKDVHGYDNVMDEDRANSGSAVVPLPNAGAASDRELIRQLRAAFAWRRRPDVLFDSVAYDDWEQAFMDTVSAVRPDELTFDKESTKGVDRYELAACMPLMSIDGLLYFLGSFLAMNVADHDRDDRFCDVFLWRLRYDHFLSFTVSEWPDKVAGLREESEQAAKTRGFGKTLRDIGQTLEEFRLSRLQRWFDEADPTAHDLIARMTEVERDAVACFFDFLAANERLDYAGPDTHAARAMLRGGSLASRLGARTKSERQSLIRSLELLESLYPSDFPADRVSPLTAALLQEA